MNTTLTCLNYSTIIHSCLVFAVQHGQSILYCGVGKRRNEFAEWHNYAGCNICRVTQKK